MRLSVILILLVLTSGSSYSQKMDIQGHRGASGVMPENTIPAFLYAIDQGVTTIDLDVVISKDNKVVVSHDLWISPEICLDASNDTFREDSDLNIYRMDYEEIKSFNCGFISRSKLSSKSPINKPLLGEVIAEVERHIKSYTLFEVDYNIEIRTIPGGEGNFHPAVPEFCDRVYNEIDQYLPLNRVIIQSLDFRVLKYWHKKYPAVRLSALIDNQKSIDTNLANLGFKPDIYSPHHRLLTKEKIRNIQKRGIKVVPWAVNSREIMAKLVNWDVDGIITGLPDVARDLNLTLPLEEEL